MGFHPMGPVTPTLNLPRQGGGNSLLTLKNSPSPVADLELVEGAGGGEGEGERSRSVQMVFMGLT